MALERRRVFYSGHVQGVGFRATCRWLARGFHVVGHVRNLADGRVELLAEGDAPEIDRFLSAIEAELGGFIRDRLIEPEPAGSSEYLDFSIRH